MSPTNDLAQASAEHRVRDVVSHTACKLDDILPMWYTEPVIKVSELDMRDPCGCIGGRVFAALFGQDELDELLHIPGGWHMIVERVMSSTIDPVEFGFDCPAGQAVTYHKLRNLWIDEILERREADQETLS